MKPLRTLTLLTLLSVCVTANAFKPGRSIIRECPQCSTAIIQQTMASGNTLSATWWTDGKVDAPMMPDYPALVKCSNCNLIFWIEDAKELGTQSPMTKGDKWDNSVYPNKLTESEFLNYLQTNPKGLTMDRAIYVRRRAWWKFNDIYRNDSSNKAHLSSRQRANLKKLILLLNEQDETQRITKAEILRELGEYQDCINMIRAKYETHGHQQVADYIESLALWRVSSVKEIVFDKSGNVQLYRYNEEPTFFKTHPGMIDISVATLAALGAGIIIFMRLKKNKPNQGLDPTR